MLRHVIDITDLSSVESRRLLDVAELLKTRFKAGKSFRPFDGRTLALIFEKPSLRTRVSFETAMTQLGGSSIFLKGDEVGLGQRESVEDFARVISQYVDILAVRTFSHATVTSLAKHATVPVINALSDAAHPCQALADLMTVEEHFGDLRGRKLAFVGDGNNVARSVAEACMQLGVEFVLAAPLGYQLDPNFIESLQKLAPDAKASQTQDAKAAVNGADVIYTDVWTSMGQEAETIARKQIFEPYQVKAELFDHAKSDAIFLHCLPAHRGEEVTADVLDHARSLVIAQAANRMHLQKALLVWIGAREHFDSLVP